MDSIAAGSWTLRHGRIDLLPKCQKGACTLHLESADEGPSKSSHPDSWRGVRYGKLVLRSRGSAGQCRMESSTWCVSTRHRSDPRYLCVSSLTPHIECAWICVNSVDCSGGQIVPMPVLLKLL